MLVKDLLEFRYELRGELFLPKVIPTFNNHWDKTFTWNLLKWTFHSQFFAHLLIIFLSKHTARLQSVFFLISHSLRRPITIWVWVVWKEALTHLFDKSSFSRVVKQEFLVIFDSLHGSRLATSFFSPIRVVIQIRLISLAADKAWSARYLVALRRVLFVILKEVLCILFAISLTALQPVLFLVHIHVSLSVDRLGLSGLAFLLDEHGWAILILIEQVLIREGFHSACSDNQVSSVCWVGEIFKDLHLDKLRLFLVMRRLFGKIVTSKTASSCTEGLGEGLSLFREEMSLIKLRRLERRASRVLRMWSVSRFLLVIGNLDDDVVGHSLLWVEAEGMVGGDL